MSEIGRRRMKAGRTARAQINGPSALLGHRREGEKPKQAATRGERADRTASALPGARSRPGRWSSRLARPGRRRYRRWRLRRPSRQGERAEPVSLLHRLRRVVRRPAALRPRASGRDTSRLLRWLMGGGGGGGGGGLLLLPLPLGGGASPRPRDPAWKRRDRVCVGGRYLRRLLLQLQVQSGLHALWLLLLLRLLRSPPVPRPLSCPTDEKSRLSSVPRRGVLRCSVAETAAAGRTS